jgi:hypothetical protein
MVVGRAGAGAGAGAGDSPEGEPAKIMKIRQIWYRYGWLVEFKIFMVVSNKGRSILPY